MATALPQEGGCLCGALRYTVASEPVHTIICHCTFCQKITGSAYLVEPIFRRKDVVFSGEFSTFTHSSDYSSEAISYRHCPKCSTKVAMDIGRFEKVWGIFGGTFDDPNWFPREGDAVHHMFTRSAQRGTVLPAGVRLHETHAFAIEGDTSGCRILDAPLLIGEREI